MTTYMPDILPTRYNVGDSSSTPLAEIVENVYGKEYDVYEAIEANNDTIYEFNMSDMQFCVDTIRESGEWGTPLEKWIADPIIVLEYGMKTCLIPSPEPYLMLSHLIVDGHLPLGIYYFRISW